MLPIMYLLVRVCVGWLQFRERSTRAFVHNSMLLTAAGVGHCCAIVSALFMAVHNRAMREHGYHDGYAERLPPSVAWAETLAFACLWVWLLAGISTAVARAVDVDSEDLSKAQTGLVRKILASPALRSGFSLAQSVSCAGLFVDIVALCITMVRMEGSITACESCVAVIALGFASPHAAVAIGRLSPVLAKALAGALPPAAVEATAAEAAAWGPQLCIILAIADDPGHASLWQNIVYVGSSLAFVVAAAACGMSPPKASGSAQPPEGTETFTCLFLDAVAVVALAMFYPDWNTWSVWATILLVSVACIAGYPLWRDEAVEWIEPVFVLRSNDRDRVQSAQRQHARMLGWTASVACAVIALGGIATMPRPEPTPPVILSSEMLLKYLPSASTKQPEEMLATVAEVLHVNASVLELETTIPEHRLVLFKGKDDSPLARRLLLRSWASAVHHPESKSKLAAIVDTTFPAALSMALCTKLGEHEGKLLEKLSDPDESDKEGHLDNKEAISAYVAACEWWVAHLMEASRADMEAARTEAKEEASEKASRTEAKEEDEDFAEEGADI